jgi:hypothetical protein
MFLLLIGGAFALLFIAFGVILIYLGDGGE